MFSELNPANVRVDWQFGITAFHLASTILLLVIFLRRHTRQLEPLHRRFWLLLFNACVSLFCNFATLVRHANGGMDCWFYILYTFMGATSVASVCVMFSLEITAETQTIDQGIHKLGIWSCLPSYKVIRSKAWLIMTSVLSLGALMAIISLAYRIGLAKDFTAGSVYCTLDLERVPLTILFAVTIVFLLTVAFSHKLRPPPSLNLAVWTIRALVLWDLFTLVPFIGLNLTNSDFFYSFEKDIFNVEIFGMFFFVGQSLVTFGFPLLISFFVEGGQILCLRINGEAMDKTLASVSRDHDNEEAMTELIPDGNQAESQLVAVQVTDTDIEAQRREKVFSVKSEFMAFAYGIQIYSAMHDVIIRAHPDFYDVFKSLTLACNAAIDKKLAIPDIPCNVMELRAVSIGYHIPTLKVLADKGKKASMEDLRAALSDMSVRIAGFLAPSTTLDRQTNMV